ncbi:hypothetical protein Btru_061200 [Bulinus truncatus]|nr:hypothetical protein Btru_061200 [Bulinus truncatus]
MGTSTEPKISGGKPREEVVIAWEYVPSNVRQELVIKLNPEWALSGNDWRMLASKLGYTQRDIMFIESVKETNTHFLFKMYGEKQNASLNEIYNCLKEMDRKDCLEIIDKAYADIYKMAVERRNDSPKYPMLDGAEGLPSGHFSWSGSAKCPLHHNSLHMSPSRCTCYCSPSPLYHHLPHFSHQDCQGRSHPYLHDNSGQHPSLPSPHQSPKMEQFGHMNTHHNHSSQDVGPVPLHNISPFDNSNISSNFNSHDSMNSQVKMARQYSDECNVSPSCSGEDRHYHNGRCTMDMGVNSYGNANMNFRCNPSGQAGADTLPTCSADPINRGRHINMKSLHPDISYSSGQAYGSNGFHSGGQGTLLCAGQGEPSLALLKSMVESQEKYRPTPEYKHVMAEQKNHTEMKSRSDNNSIDSVGSLSSSSSSGSSSGKSRPSSTFPLRIKNKIPVEDITQLKISKKSASMPQNMKPAQYRKVFRNTKVFVTYSFDNEGHARQVLSLCKFLQTNGFACYVDVCEKNPVCSTEQIIDWCSKKISEADFILVCVSTKYLQDIDSNNKKNVHQGSDKKLHTKEIFGLLESEHSRNNGFSSSKQIQIVPLLFGNMQASSLPNWMTANRPAYEWPKQYLDLAWMLTKPQERIKVSKRSMEGVLDSICFSSSIISKQFTCIHIITLF